MRTPKGNPYEYATRAFLMPLYLHRYHGHKGDVRMGTSCIIHFFAEQYQEGQYCALKIKKETQELKIQRSKKCTESQPFAACLCPGKLLRLEADLAAKKKVVEKRQVELS